MRESSSTRMKIISSSIRETEQRSARRTHARMILVLWRLAVDSLLKVPSTDSKRRVPKWSRYRKLAPAQTLNSLDHHPMRKPVPSTASGSTHHSLNSTLSPQVPEKSRQFTRPTESASQNGARTKSERHPNCKAFSRITNSRTPSIHRPTLWPQWKAWTLQRRASTRQAAPARLLTAGDPQHRST